MSEITLEEAVDYIKKVTPEDDPWTAADVSPYESTNMVDHIDHCIAAILNAVVSGDLVLRSAMIDYLTEEQVEEVIWRNGLFGAV